MAKLMVVLASMLLAAATLSACSGDATAPQPKKDNCYQQCRWVGDHFDCVTVCP